jgi:PAS domain S-box-containing protein
MTAKPKEPTIQTGCLAAMFDASPMGVIVERQTSIVYTNAAASGLTGKPDRRPTATWTIELDSGSATVMTFAAESQLERLYSEAAVGLAFVDEELRYRRVNDRMAELNGVAAAEHVGKTIAEVLPHLAVHLEQMVRQVLDSGKPIAGLELSGPDWTHRGRERHCIVNYHPFRDGGARGVQASVIEVTGLKEKERALVRQAKIFEQVHDSVIQTDLEGRIVAWNGGAESIFGYRADQIVGQSVSLLYFEEDRRDLGRLVMEPLMEKGQHEVVLRNRKKDGSECWVRLSLSLLRDEGGSPYGLVGYSVDITARRRAEAALEASRARYRRLFEASPVGIAVWEAGGRIVQANAVFLAMMGWNGEQLAAGILKWPERSVSRFTAAETAPEGAFEEELIRDDGRRFPALIGLAQQEDSETLAYVVDLTVQKEAESAARKNREYLDLALLGADLGVWDWNIATGQGMVNERWARMLEYAWHEIEPYEAAWARLVHPDDLPRRAEAMRAHLQGKTASYHCEYRMLAKTGEWRWIWSRGQVIERSAEGAPLRAAGTHLDISARKEADLALARSEQRFHAIFDHTFQFIGLLTPDGLLVEANQTALDFGGVKKEEVLQRPFWEIATWGASSRTREDLRKAIARAATGEFVRYEVDVWDAAASVETVDFSLRPMLDAEGRVSMIIAEGRNITDLKRAQKVLHAEGEKRRLQAVLRSMTQGVVIGDPEGTVVSMNPAALELFGLPSEEQAKRKLREFQEFELRSLDGASVPIEEWPLARVARGEAFTGYELEVCRRDSGKHWIANFAGAPVHDEEGRVILLVISLRDVTHQHEVERALRQSNIERDFALQAGQMRTWRWEFKAGEEAESAVTAAMLGLEVDGCAGEQVFEQIHPEDRQRVREFGRKMQGDTSYEIEYRKACADGTYRWEESRGRAIVSGRGEAIGMAGVTWDITEQKKAEADIASMNASLHQLSGRLLRLQDEERRRLARELHDGPVQVLSAASMNLSMLTRSRQLMALDRERRLTEECLGWVKQCSQAMRSMSYLLHPPILDELGLTSALRGWITGFADRTGLEVEADLVDVGRLSAESETALFRIVQEALGNVQKHSRSSTVSIKLHRAGGYIQLEVKDNGCGMASGVLEGWSSAHALGVGIQGMRERALQLGGRMEIHSPRGEGTLLRIVIPEQERH